MKMNVFVSTLLGLSILMGATQQGSANAEIQAESGRPVFARVNGEIIYQSAYDTALRVGGRQRFYHGKAPEAELVAYRREVAERLVVEKVLYQEALRQGMSPDQAWVDKEFAKIEKRYSVSPQWHESGEPLQRKIRDGLAERSLIRQLDQAYKSAPVPAEQEVRAYYERNPDKFTSPEQMRVSTILLKVEPWQPKAVWDDTRSTAQQIHAALSEGAEFDTYAAQHPPEDESQMGYIHRGMLGDTAQAAIDQLKEGEYTEPVTLLEGIGIFRLDARREARLNSFEKVRERATALLSREQSERLYRERITALRASASVEFTNPLYYEVASVGALQDSSHLRADKKKE
jgi:peptidyl-prolyl cis-trans isomerase C